jgi:hypothetical protein
MDNDHLITTAALAWIAGGKIRAEAARGKKGVIIWPGLDRRLGG